MFVLRKQKLNLDKIKFSFVEILSVLVIKFILVRKYIKSSSQTLTEPVSPIMLVSLQSLTQWGWSVVTWWPDPKLNPQQTHAGRWDGISTYRCYYSPFISTAHIYLHLLFIHAGCVQLLLTYVMWAGTYPDPEKICM